MNIGLLGCDDVPERLRALAGTYRSMFENLLKPHLPDAEFTWFEARSGDLPQAADACDGYVCTGSRYSVYERRDWMQALEQCIRDIRDAGTPFIGVCFGHQMLAQALGGEVTKADQGWGIGIHDMQVTQPEDWMQPQQEHCKLQYMHADQVQRLPSGSVVLASARHCPVAMFRVGRTMLGIEGHPEFSADYVEALLKERKERIGAAQTDAALESLSQKADDSLVARWMANFLKAR